MIGRPLTFEVDGWPIEGARIDPPGAELFLDENGRFLLGACEAVVENFAQWPLADRAGFAWIMLGLWDAESERQLNRKVYTGGLVALEINSRSGNAIRAIEKELLEIDIQIEIWTEIIQAVEAEREEGGG